MPVNVLLVDDQPSRRLTYRAVLEPLGEKLFDATSGEDALRLLMQHDFAVILLDVNMPGMDGFETATLIHQHPRFVNTPIIFVTAVNVDDMDRLRGYKLGAVDYVMVPVIPEILRSKVMVLCELARKRRDLERANLELAEAHAALQAEKDSELAQLNKSLQVANSALHDRNSALLAEVDERSRIEGRLRDLDRRKDQFLATLAHELRNPLAPLQNALMVRKLSSEIREDPLHKMMERQTRQLVRLIDDLLDVARVSQGKINLQRRPTTLREVLLPAIDAVRPLIEEHGHTLVLALSDEEIVFNADPERLTQVFSNLLNNAAKYSEEPGQIILNASIVDQTLHVSVSDEGMGLTPEEIEQIFDLFAQLERGSRNAQGGLGLGLTLVRELVTMHGGNIEVESDGPGFGSVFRVELPLEISADLPSAVAEEDVVTESEKIFNRVLVVDDNQDVADSLAMMVRMLGHEARAMYEPRDVIEVMAEYAPTIVFLDIGMPELDGRSLATQLRQLPSGESLTLVAVSGWGQLTDIQASLDAGFNRHLVKPPSLDAIREICETKKI